MKLFSRLLSVAVVYAVAIHLAFAQPTPTACEIEDIACVNTPDDSQWNNGNPIRIDSKDAIPAPVYHKIVSRYHFLPIPPFWFAKLVTLDYMVHDPAQTPLGLVVLIARGQLDAGIEGIDNGPVTAAGGNFLVRSAHLFRDQGYRVVTIDQPSDFEDFFPPGQTGDAGFLLDD